MKTVLLILIGILLIVIFFLLQENRRITFQIKQQQQEIKASGEYIRILNSRLLENKFTEEAPGDKDSRIRELLADYLNEKQSEGSEIYHQARKIEREKMFIPDLLPLKGDYQMSQGFKSDHQGLDFAAPLGREVLSAAAGLVTAVYRDKYFGNVIEIDHLNG
ncbi:MAG: M23 family metallopeptidase, partial [Candidatus Cloacimonetes bacterium]|nr:M23 family metallopeptidase [Candidatus Cloacimonadota bacterium]